MDLRCCSIGLHGPSDLALVEVSPLCKNSFVLEIPKTFVCLDLSISISFLRARISLPCWGSRFVNQRGSSSCQPFSGLDHGKRNLFQVQPTISVTWPRPSLSKGIVCPTFEHLSDNKLQRYSYQQKDLTLAVTSCRSNTLKPNFGRSAHGTRNPKYQDGTAN